MALPGSVVYSCLMGMQTHARRPAGRMQIPSPPETRDTAPCCEKARDGGSELDTS